MAVFLVVLTLALFRRREWDPIRIDPPAEPAGSRSCDAAEAALDGASARCRHLAGARCELGLRRGRGQETRKRLLAQEHGHLPRRQGSGPEARRARASTFFPSEAAITSRENTTWSMPSDQPLDEILLTAAPHWEKLAWTMDDKPFTPKNSAGLFIFTPPNGTARSRREGTDRV